MMYKKYVFIFLTVFTVFLTHTKQELSSYSWCEKSKDCTQHFSRLQKDIHDQLSSFKTHAKAGELIRKIIEGEEQQNKAMPIKNTLTADLRAHATFSCYTEREKLSVIMQVPTPVMYSHYAAFVEPWLNQTHNLKVGNNIDSLSLPNTSATLQKNVVVDERLTLGASGQLHNKITPQFSITLPLELSEIQQETLRIFHTKGRFNALEYIKEHEQEFPASRSNYKTTVIIAGTALGAFLITNYADAIVKGAKAIL